MTAMPNFTYSWGGGVETSETTQALPSAERLWVFLAPAAGPASQRLCHTAPDGPSERHLAMPNCPFSLRPSEASWRRRLPKTKETLGGGWAVPTCHLQEPAFDSTRHAAHVRMFPPTGLDVIKTNPFFHAAFMARICTSERLPAAIVISLIFPTTLHIYALMVKNRQIYH